jgi:hypothetical protein
MAAHDAKARRGAPGPGSSGRPKRRGWEGWLLLALLLVSLGTLSLGGPAAADPAGCPCSLWSGTDGPTNVDSGDDRAVELGVQFTVDVPVPVTGVRFYKAAANTGTHVGSLWSADGTLLARATFTGETASGWQRVSFSPAVNAVPGARYVASYHAPAGHYSFDGGYFTGVGRDQDILHAPGGDLSAPNGLFAYSPVPTFPTGTFNGNNYWVDVVVGSDAPVLTGLSVSPVPAPLLVGATAALSAMGAYSDGVSSDVTARAAWASSAPAVASVSPAGVVTATGPGTATITATVASVTASTTVTVRTVTGLAVGGTPVSLAKGLARPLTATATFSDGTAAVVTTAAAWASAKPAVATVSAAGVLKATGVGSTTISATFGGVTTSVPVTVTAATVTAVTVTPASAVTGLLGTLQLKATAAYTDGTTADVSGQVRWASSNSFVVLVSRVLAPGRLLGLLPGTATITAEIDGVRGSTTVTVRW